KNPPEKTVVLAHILAPRLVRRGGKDEPFAWDSREYLRKLCIGKDVVFQTEYTIPNVSFEFCSVFVGCTNVGNEVVTHGWAKVKKGKGEKTPDHTELLRLEEQAKQQGVGLWKSIKKEACWTISNITAGNKDQIQTVSEANSIVQLLQNAEFDIKKEAALAISNAISGGNHDLIKYLVSQGCVKPLCDLLVCPDPRIVSVCLEGLENILKVEEAEKNLGGSVGINLYAQMIDYAEGLEKIENLESHYNNEIREKSVKLLETYWLVEEEDVPPPGILDLYLYENCLSRYTSFWLR
ncbi:importin subunit alpha-1b-like, partial [Rutidosis leptorrhynchoides]|uniref:importin subunit alpha-1b-like n=1 Tax=Rutidosis leptorrhynchoides TaxID=125765 RepID=UPI003A9990F1